MTHWVCKECSQEIQGDDGCVLIYNGDSSLGAVGDYPCHPPSPKRVEGTSDLISWPEAIQEWQDSFVERTRVQWRAAHDKCNPFTSDELNPYYISIGEVPTLEKWVRWMDHIASKTWLTKNDLSCLTQYWFSHKPDKQVAL